MGTSRVITIYAQNINTGGAQHLLHTLIEHVIAEYPQVQLRVLTGSQDDIHIRHPRLTLEVLPTTLSKILAMLRQEENVLYFGNLPPLRQSQQGMLYIHNAYMTASNEELWKDDRIPYKGKAKLFLLRTYLEQFAGNVDVVACQTPSMSQRLEKFLSSTVRRLPFYKEVLPKTLPKQYDLCYVGLPSAHKNHERLLDALALLSQRGVTANVALTIPDFPENQHLFEKMNEIQAAGRINLANFGMGPFELVLRIYNSSRALVFPSLKESFGLPVIEAVSLGLELLIAELPYADDVVSGGGRFDPLSVESMADCMQRWLENPETIPPVELRTSNAIDRIVQYLLGWE